MSFKNQNKCYRNKVLITKKANVLLVDMLERLKKFK